MANKSEYPVIRRFDITGGSQDFCIVDTMKCASRMNHRLYRQTRIPTCNVRLRQGSALTKVDVYVLRNDWTLRNSIKMAYEQYQKATSETRAVMSKSQIARWEDFRIDHGFGVGVTINEAIPLLYTNTFSGTPPYLGQTLMNTGEFILTTVQDDSGVTHTFTLGSAASNEYNILDEYDKAANTSTSPSSTVTGNAVPYEGLDDDIDGVIANDLEDNGNNPPYDANSIQGDSPWIRVGTLGVGVGHSTLSTGQFEAPLGFILLRGYTYSGTGGESEEGSISIELKAGSYKGIHAPSIVE